MDYAYLAYGQDKKIVKGKLSATNEQAATTLLSYGGYQIVSLKAVTPFFQTERVATFFSRIQPKEIVMLSRQLALLLESGADIVSSLELLQNQAANRTLKKVVGEVAADIRGGSLLSAALNKHPRVFSRMYVQAMAAGEQGGNLEVVLRQMADYIERAVTIEKKVKGALTYPFILTILTVIVVLLLVTYVLPTFASLYAAFNVELPFLTRLMIGVADWSSHYGIYIIGLVVLSDILGIAYVRTSLGRYRWHKFVLSVPILGRISQLSELARCCRTISLLFKVGLPLPDIMSLAINGSKNVVVADALTGVRHELIRGEGLSKPMSKRKIFLPLMIQMIRVGEETGNLDVTLSTVAQAYEAEADEATSGAVALIQPIMTIVLGLIIGLVALSLVSAMYSLYGQLGM